MAEDEVLEELLKLARCGLRVTLAAVSQLCAKKRLRTLDSSLCERDPLAAKGAETVTSG